MIHSPPLSPSPNALESRVRCAAAAWASRAWLSVAACLAGPNSGRASWPVLQQSMLLLAAGRNFHRGVPPARAPHVGMCAQCFHVAWPTTPSRLQRMSDSSPATSAAAGPPPTLAPFNPTADDAIAAGLQLLPASELRAHDRVVEVGCGDARWLCAYASACAHRPVEDSPRFIGIELDSELVAKANARVAAAGLESLVQIHCQDAAAGDWEQSATVLLLYLVPAGMAIIAPKLASLAPGTRIVSNFFSVPSISPVHRVVTPRTRVMLYHVGSEQPASAVSTSTAAAAATNSSQSLSST